MRIGPKDDSFVNEPRWLDVYVVHVSVVVFPTFVYGALVLDDNGICLFVVGSDFSSMVLKHTLKGCLPA